MADTTTTTGRCRFCSVQIPAATLMRSAEPMLVPPNFITRRLFISVRSFLPVRRTVADELQQRRFHFVDGEAGRIHINRVRRLHERRLAARAITLVTLVEVLCHDVGWQ